MKRLFILFVLIFISIPISFSCQRVSDIETGELKTVNIPNLKGIPMAYGSLISVTSGPSGNSQLWFQDDNGTVRRVAIRLINNMLYQTVTVIPRY